MELALSLFPDLDGLDGAFDESWPWIAAWAVLITAGLLTTALAGLILHIRETRA